MTTIPVSGGAFAAYQVIVGRGLLQQAAKLQLKIKMISRSCSQLQAIKK